MSGWSSRASRSSPHRTVFDNVAFPPKMRNVRRAEIRQRVTQALTMSDRIAVLQGGRIVQIDRPEALYDRP